MGTLCFRIKARGISGKRESKDSKIPAIATVKQAMEVRSESEAEGLPSPRETHARADVSDKGRRNKHTNVAWVTLSRRFDQDQGH